MCDLVLEFSRIQLDPATADVSGAADLTGVDLSESTNPLSAIEGSINVVNPGDGSLTTVVLIPEGVFQQLSPTFVRGDVPPGPRPAQSRAWRSCASKESTASTRWPPRS